jgi:hypothetical protein
MPGPSSSSSTESFVSSRRIFQDRPRRSSRARRSCRSRSFCFWPSSSWARFPSSIGSGSSGRRLSGRSWAHCSRSAAGGAASTLAAHLVKSTTRWTSTAATRGFAQLALSLAEDVVAIVLAILVFFVPWFAVVLLVALAVLLMTHRVSVGHAVRVLFLRLQHPRRALRQAARRG